MVNKVGSKGVRAGLKDAMRLRTGASFVGGSILRYSIPDGNIWDDANLFKLPVPILRGALARKGPHGSIARGIGQAGEILSNFLAGPAPTWSTMAIKIAGQWAKGLMDAYNDYHSH